MLATAAHSPSGETRVPAPSASTATRRPPGLWDDVELDQELRRAAQLARGLAACCDVAPAGQRESLGHSFWPASTSTPGAHAASPASTTAPPSPVARPSATTGEARAADTPTGVNLAAIGSVLGGALLLFGGLGFLALAVVDQRPDWWQPGLPLALLGQAALTVGVVLRLERPSSPPSA